MKLFLVGLVVAMIGCTQTPTPKTVATDAVNVSETAWLLAATACQASSTPAVKVKCANVLLPARAALLAAALDVDNGGTNFGCELAQVSSALAFVATLGVPLPQGVKDAQSVLATIPCVAPPADAGSPLAVLTGTQDAALVLASPPSSAVVLDGGTQ